MTGALSSYETVAGNPIAAVVEYFGLAAELPDDCTCFDNYCRNYVAKVFEQRVAVFEHVAESVSVI